MSDHVSSVSIRSLLHATIIDSAAAKAAESRWGEASDVLLNGLLEAGVMSEKPDWITPQGWYSFLNADLLDHQIPPPTPVKEGDTERHMVGVNYDQVRHDSPETMLNTANGLLLDIINVTEPFTSGSLLADTVRNGEDVQSREEAVTKILAWRQQWTKTEPEAFESKGIMRGPDGATYFTFDCAFTAFAKTGSVTEYDGDGAVQFITVKKRLEIVGLMMPGFAL
ncbi:MAG: hypothetical protein AB8F78_01575 [Saprospiraceae bacterium]